jgi:hypothetical protein
MAMGLAETMPVMYKNLESFFTGDTNSSLGKKATKAENWFKKYESSMSYEGRSKMISGEMMGTLVSDIFA